MAADTDIESALDIEALLGAAAREILGHEDPQRFRRWLDEQLPSFVLDERLAEDADACRALATVLGRSIWNATPLPGNRFRPAPLPPVGRNDRCPCDSGRKYKQCCGAGPSVDAVSSDEMWSFVVEELPPDALARAMANREVPVVVIATQALHLLVDEDDPEAAATLIEPLFEGELVRLDAAPHALAFDVLDDAYTALDWQDTRLAFIERVIGEARRSPLRAAAWQRLATLRMGEGDADGAWDAFEQAQRDEPESPDLAHLEILLLADEERMSEIPSRARAWIRRLRRRGFESGDDVIQWLSRVADDPKRVLAELSAIGQDGEGAYLRRWLDEVEQRPLPGSWTVASDSDLPLAGHDESRRSQLRAIGVPNEQIDDLLARMGEQLESLQAAGAEPDDEPGDGPDSLLLVAPPDIQELERRWREVFVFEKPFSVDDQSMGGGDAWDSEEAWGEFLLANPQAFDSIDILDDLATAVTTHPLFGDIDFEQQMYVPLLARGASIVERTLDTVAAPRLAWVIGANRPALRPLARLASWELEAGDRSRAVVLMEWLVALNPGDNHGFRCILMDEYLHAGRNEEAAALAAQFPDDVFAETRYGNVLALYRQQRVDDARAALVTAARQLPKVARYLLRKRVPKSRLGADESFSIGSDEQAWDYWRGMRGEWEATTGALAWMKRELPAD